MMCVCLCVCLATCVGEIVFESVCVCACVFFSQCTRGVVVETVSSSIDPVWVYINRKTHIADVSSITFDPSPLLHSLAVYLVYLFSPVTLCFDWLIVSLLFPELFYIPLWLTLSHLTSLFQV